MVKYIWYRFEKRDKATTQKTRKCLSFQFSLPLYIYKCSVFFNTVHFTGPIYY